MAILKIRDKDGNVQEILVIKGEDGKDYVLTEKDKQEIAAMISASAVAPVDIDTSDFALKSDIPDVSGFAKKTEIPSVPTNVSAFTNDAGYLTQHQSLADYAKKTDLPNMGNYYSKDDLDQIIESADGRLNDLENPNTEAWTFTLENGSTVTKTVVLK